MTDLSVDIGGMAMGNPVMTASGTFGYACEYAEFVDLNRLGAVGLKSVTVEPREGNAPPRPKRPSRGHGHQHWALAARAGRQTRPALSHLLCDRALHRSRIQRGHCSQHLAVDIVGVVVVRIVGQVR